jgi:spore coat polysaccharide biosynthesis protein SpsF
VINAVVVLQARMASTRLPGKVMARLGAHTLLAHCIRRLQAAEVGPVVVATTTGAEDDVVEAEATRLRCMVVRGSIDDVLGRFVMVSVAVPSRWIVRATADNPAVDSESASRLLHALDESGAEYGVERGHPYGAAVEVIATSTLRRVAELTTDPHDREHVTPYVRSHGDRFRILTPDVPVDVRRPDLRLTVDTAEDLEFMRLVLQKAEVGPSPAQLQTVIAAADAVERERGTHAHTA